MELIILGVFMVISFWLGYKMGLRDPLEVKLPEKLKALVMSDEELAKREKIIEANRAKN